MQSSAPLGTLGAALCCLALGCGGSSSSSDKAFQRMQEQLSQMRADSDRVHQRLEALEIALADEKEQREREAKGRMDRGRTGPGRTVSLRSEGVAHEEGDADDPTARPAIRVVGGAGQKGPRGKTSAVAYVEGDDGPTTEGPRPSALDPDAKRAYESALDLIRAKQFDRGLEAMTSFLVRWPGHPYAENAMYWRGEAYYARGEFARAAEEFEAVVARFATGTKVPDALLKLGMCLERLGAQDRAEAAWQRLRDEFPRSAVVRMIPSRERGASSSKPTMVAPGGTVSKESKESR